MTDCLFCKIIAREIPASIVYEDDRILAFNDIHLQAPTHVLVVPKRHIATLNDLSPEDDQIVGELVRRAAAIAKERGISAGGRCTGPPDNGSVDLAIRRFRECRSPNRRISRSLNPVTPEANG